jgi:hypothetical protein
MCLMWSKGTPAMTRIGSDGVPFKNAQGEQDVLSLGELDAVEITGRCSWQEYLRYATQWPSVTVPVDSLMDARPGQTTPGKYLAHVPLPVSVSAKTFDEMQKGGIHWKVNSRSACDSVFRPGGMFSGPQFARASSNARRCEACSDLYRTLVREGMKWSRDDVRTLRTMWKHFERREECARLLRRTFQSCLLKWGMIR